jgi:hypothetical protein
MVTSTIRSTSEYLSVIQKHVVRSSHGKFTFFRGQDDHALPLLPGIARCPFKGKEAICMDPNDPADKSAERRLIVVLRDYGITLFPSWVWHGCDAEVRWKQIIVAQHYRLPTRLLDWTTNPLAALFFATYGPAAMCVGKKKCVHCNKNGGHDAAVFAVMNHDTFSVTSLALKNLTPPLYHGPKDPGFLRPPEIDRRIAAQGSIFSIRSNPMEPIEPDLKLRIPARKRRLILRELDELGVNTKGLFPDLEGIARYLKWNVQFWHPNPGVFPN